MKNFIITIAMFLLGISQMNAQKLYVNDVEIPEKGQATLTFNYETGDKTIVYYGFYMILPEGISFEENPEAEGVPAVSFVDGRGFNLNYSNGNYGFLPIQATSKIQGTEGTLFTMTLKADETLKQGDKFEVEVGKVTFAERKDNNNIEFEVASSTYTITIVENRITLDENATELPTETGTQNVLVKRTIKADQWNTICLPFDIAQADMETAFGEGVEVAEFTNWSSDENDEGDITGISVEFTATNEIKANTPAIIKVKNTVTEFKLDNVNIDVDKEPQVLVGKKKAEKGYFIGTYVAETLVPEDNLFISGNKFYYSNGTTKMKAFRGYFEFADTMTDKSIGAGAKINFSVDGEATAIEGLSTGRTVEGVYDLQGRKVQIENNDVNRLQKGVYIIDGKKVTIK